MKDVTSNSYARYIDSFQKLRFLLFLYHHPNIEGTLQEFAEKLYLGPTPLLEKIIMDLQQAELIDQVENCYKLPDKPKIRSWLQGLATDFEDPVTRQRMLDQINQASTSPSFRSTSAAML
jgi:hypothetical protein